MPLETATYIVSLVITNPDGSDQKNTSDDHLRLIKACLKRSFPLIDGAVSLSHTQLMRLNDVSASVQLQFNTLRDGSATVYNALYANSASFAANANNALSLGGVAASAYIRFNVANTFTALQTYTVPSGEQMRMAAGVNDFISWYNAAQTTRLGYVQVTGDGRVIIVNDQAGGHIDLHASDVRLNGSSTFWHAGNDGGNSGLDADRVWGLLPDINANGSTVVTRWPQGYVYATYFNQSSNEQENPNVANIIVTSGDGFFRKATPSYLGSQISTRNISNKAGTNKTLSSSSPSGGSDGDIWYRI